MTALPGIGPFRNFSTEIAIGTVPMEESVEKFLTTGVQKNDRDLHLLGSDTVILEYVQI